MKPKFLFGIVLVALLVFLAGCAQATVAPTATPAVPGRQGGGPGGGQIPSNAFVDADGNLTQEVRLSAGSLQLEGTSQALSADQAKILLPLWQQVRTANGSALQDIYSQIRSSLTADQLKVIDNLAVADVQTLATKYGRGGNQNLTTEQRATRQAQMETQGPGGAAPGGIQGTPPAGGRQGTPPADFTPPAGGRIQGTPGMPGAPGPGAGRGGPGGLGLSFVDSLIQLLQERLK
jgi:hypothetical protein